MKKIFAFMAVAALLFTACEKEGGKHGNGGKNKGGNDDYEAPIKIDGNFDDWAALDGTKIATAKSDDEATKTALKVVKVYADEVFVFVYFEWDKEQIAYEKDVEHVPFHIYINGDGDASTGGFLDQWSDACIDTCFEGSIYPDGVLGSYDPGVYKWTGEVNGEGWSWAEILPPGSGICSGAGVEGKYELQIARDLYPDGTLADNFSIGFDIQQNWDSVGVLPNSHVDDVNTRGNAPSLQVVTVK